MKKQYGSAVGLVAMGVMLAFAPSLLASELLGGYFNSSRREAALSIQSGNQVVQLMNTVRQLQWGSSRYGSSKLFVVDYSNRISEYRSAFRDSQGHSISIPQGAYDKVVFLNRYGNIAMVAGLDSNDLNSLVAREDLSQANVIMSAQQTPVFGGLHYSSHVIKEMRADAATIASTFVSSVRMMAGSDVATVVQKVMDRAAPNSLKGVSLVAQGGDGGGGNALVNPIAQGGDGGGGNALINPIAQGGDGGGGNALVNPIAQGGDGGGGNAIVNDVSIKAGTQSWSTMPKVNGLNALTLGKVISIQ